MSWDCDNVCRVIEDGIPNNCSRFLSPPAKLFVFGLPGCLLAGVHVGRSRGKGNAFCESVSRKLFVFLSEIKKKLCWEPHSTTHLDKTRHPGVKWIGSNGRSTCLSATGEGGGQNFTAIRLHIYIHIDCLHQSLARTCIWHACMCARLLMHRGESSTFLSSAYTPIPLNWGRRKKRFKLTPLQNYLKLPWIIRKAKQQPSREWKMW